MERVSSSSPEETMAIAEQFAGQARPGDIILLSGDLGAGKTHFVKGFARHFGIPEGHVSSPTYSIVQEYHGDGVQLYHIDAYRLESEKEALGIGLDETLDGDGICLVEWPERIAGLIPADHWTVKVRTTGSETREITISRPSSKDRFHRK